MIFLVEPLPSGAACRLTVAVGEESTTTFAVYASSLPTPPVGPPGPAYRLVADGMFRWHRTASRIAIESPQRHWYQTVDMHPTLRAETPVYYHCLFSVGDPLTVQVTPTRRMEAQAVVLRDILKPRIEYALNKAIAANRLGPRVNHVPVYEQDVLAKDQPLPAVLVKETQTFISQPIGGIRGEWKRLGDGKMFIERTRLYRARLDMLAISENPSERTILGNILQEMVQTDWPLLEEAGYREITDQRMTRGGQDPEGLVIFAEEVTVDGVIELVTREEMLYAVSPDFGAIMEAIV